MIEQSCGYRSLERRLGLRSSSTCNCLLGKSFEIWWLSTSESKQCSGHQNRSGCRCLDRWMAWSLLACSIRKEHCKKIMTFRSCTCWSARYFGRQWWSECRHRRRLMEQWQLGGWNGIYLARKSTDLWWLSTCLSCQCFENRLRCGCKRLDIGMA